MPVAGTQWHGRLWPVGLGHEMSVFEVKAKERRYAGNLLSCHYGRHPAG
jgi:hypothetical protein